MQPFTVSRRFAHGWVGDHPAHLVHGVTVRAAGLEHGSPISSLACCFIAKQVYACCSRAGSGWESSSGGACFSIPSMTVWACAATGRASARLTSLASGIPSAGSGATSVRQRWHGHSVVYRVGCSLRSKSGDRAAGRQFAQRFRRSAGRSTEHASHQGVTSWECEVAG